MGVLVTVRTRFRGGTSCSSRERLPRLRYARTHRGGTGARLSFERKGSSVEVKIGVTDSPRELVFNSAQTPSEVEKSVTDALSRDSGVLSLTDEKGRRFLVQTAKIAYVEISAADVRRVGFGIGAVGAEAVKNA